MSKSCSNIMYAGNKVRRGNKTYPNDDFHVHLGRGMLTSEPKCC